MSDKDLTNEQKLAALTKTVEQELAEQKFIDDLRHARAELDLGQVIQTQSELERKFLVNKQTIPAGTTFKFSREALAELEARRRNDLERRRETQDEWYEYHKAQSDLGAQQLADEREKREQRRQKEEFEAVLKDPSRGFPTWPEFKAYWEIGNGLVISDASPIARMWQALWLRHWASIEATKKRRRYPHVLAKMAFIIAFLWVRNFVMSVVARVKAYINLQKQSRKVKEQQQKLIESLNETLKAIETGATTDPVQARILKSIQDIKIKLDVKE